MHHSGAWRALCGGIRRSSGYLYKTVFFVIFQTFVLDQLHQFSRCTWVCVGSADQYTYRMVDMAASVAGAPGRPERFDRHRYPSARSRQLGPLRDVTGTPSPATHVFRPDPQLRRQNRVWDASQGRWREQVVEAIRLEEAVFDHKVPDAASGGQ